MLNDVYPEGGDGHGGLLYDLRRRTEKVGLSPTVKQTLDRQVLQAQQRVEQVRDLFREFFTVLGEFMAQDRSTTGPYGQRLRIERKVRSQPGWTNVKIAWDTAGLPLFELAEALEKLRVGLTELDQTGVPGLDDLVTDFSSLTGQLSEAYLQDPPRPPRQPAGKRHLLGRGRCQRAPAIDPRGAVARRPAGRAASVHGKGQRHPDLGHAAHGRQLQLHPGAAAHAGGSYGHRWIALRL